MAVTNWEGRIGMDSYNQVG